MMTSEPTHGRHDDHSTTRSRWERDCFAATMCLALLAAGLGACNCTLGFTVEGWVVVCNPEAEYDGTAPDEICMHKAIEGGVDESSMAQACYELLLQHDPSSQLTPEDFCGVEIKLDENGEKVACVYGDEEAYPFSIQEFALAGGGDEVGSNEPVDPDVCEGIVRNAVRCTLEDPVSVDNERSEENLFWFPLCDPDPSTNLAGKTAACEDACDLWVATWESSGYTQSEGSCDANDFTVQAIYEPSCMTNGSMGDLLAGAVTVGFEDANNSITELGSGAIAIDDSGCSGGVPCEPWVLMKFTLPFTSFEYEDDVNVTHDVEATSLVLSTMNPVQVVHEPTGGTWAIDEVELELTAGDVSIDAVSIGPVQLRDFLGPIDVSTNPTNGEMTFTGTIVRDDFEIDFTFVGDPSRPASWP